MQPNDEASAAILMAIVRDDCARLATSRAAATLLAWMVHELDECAGEYDVSPATRLEMRRLSREARERLRESRQAAA